MPSRLTFHFSVVRDALVVETADDPAHWREAFGDYSQDGRATITDSRGHVFHVNLEHCAYVEVEAA